MHPLDYHFPATVNCEQYTETTLTDLSTATALEIGEALIPINDPCPAEVASCLLGLTGGELFLHDRAEDESASVYRASPDQGMRRGIAIEPGRVSKRTPTKRPIEWDEFCRYETLIRDYLRGDVIPVREQAVFVRQDTDDELSGPIEGV
jgi:hypothetical protein